MGEARGEVLVFNTIHYTLYTIHYTGYNYSWIKLLSLSPITNQNQYTSVQLLTLTVDMIVFRSNKVVLLTAQGDGSVALMVRLVRLVGL